MRCCGGKKGVPLREKVMRAWFARGRGGGECKVPNVGEQLLVVQDIVNHIGIIAMGETCETIRVRKKQETI
jgi:hypothetical protein